jgi:hypothetical protein
MPTLSSTRVAARPQLLAALVVAAALLMFGGGQVVADESTQIIQSRSLDNFDDPDAVQWSVRGSKFAATGFPAQAYVNAWPDALFPRNVADSESLHVLGVRSQFDRGGYNTIEIIPVTEGADGLEPKPIRIPGRVQSFDLWVWGANYNYTMEIHLRDHEGVDHSLPLGSLKFNGWRQLSVRVPGSIQQQQQQLPRLKGLEVTKLVIWTQPGERVDDFFVYLDEFNILTDIFEARFDGEDLVVPALVESVWGGN